MSAHLRGLISLRCLHKVTLYPDVQADLNLRWAHVSTCTFSEVVAHGSDLKNQNCFRTKNVLGGRIRG